MNSDKDKVASLGMYGFGFSGIQLARDMAWLNELKASSKKDLEVQFEEFRNEMRKEITDKNNELGDRLRAELHKEMTNKQQQILDELKVELLSQLDKKLGKIEVNFRQIMREELQLAIKKQDREQDPEWERVEF